MRNVAIIGAGIGQKHLEGFRTLPDKFQVTTVCDLNTARAQAMVDTVCGTGPAPGVTDDLNGVLSDEKIDIVDICLPPHLHVSVTLQALAAGKHVICEKPIAGSLAEVDQIEAAAKAAGREVFPVFQYRFGIARAQIAALTQAGLLGKAHAAHVETHWNRGADYYAEPWRGTWAGENGGAILSHAIHNHDLLISLLGPIARLSAFTTTRVNPIEVEDCVAIAFQMENGAIATSNITLGAADDQTRFRVIFEGVTAESQREPYAPMACPWTFLARDPAHQAMVDQTLAEVTPVQPGFSGYFNAIADALDGRPNAAVRLPDGRQSIELVTAIYTAARTGAQVTLPLETGNPLYKGWRPDT